MLYHLFTPLEEHLAGFRLFQYISFRAAAAAILAFLVATIVGPGIIESLKQRKISGFVPVGDPKVDADRLAKASVPTMGGVILLIGVGISGFLFARLDTPVTWIVLLSFLAFGALGAADDWKKLTHQGGRGLSERQKVLGQLVIALLALGALSVLGAKQDGLALVRGPSVKANPYERPWIQRHVVLPGETWSGLAGTYLGDAERGPEVARLNGVDPALLDEISLQTSATTATALGAGLLPLPGRQIQLPAAWPNPRDHHRTDLQIPLFKGFCLDLGLLFLPLGVLVIVGASNAVNLTDGLDGLAIGVTLTVAICFAIVAYLVGRIDFSRALHLFYVPEGGELAVILAALVGGSLGFLWFNGHPASVFMGDTGSLSIGGILGVCAVALRHEITLLIAGGMFVAEAASVIWQRAYFKGTRRKAQRAGVPDATGTRWFLCAPLHHHYEKRGLHENKVTIRFWIVSVICVLAALASLKVR